MAKRKKKKVDTSDDKAKVDPDSIIRKMVVGLSTSFSTRPPNNIKQFETDQKKLA